MAAETPKQKPTTGPLIPLSGWLALVAFLVGISGAFYLWWYETQSSVLISVLAHDLPAYHQIQSSDLTQQTYPSRRVTSKTLRETIQMVGRYTLVAIPQQQPLSDDQLGPVVDTALIFDTIAIGVPATPAMVLGGGLHAGDVVDIVLVPAATEAEPSPSPVLFENILILDVRPSPESQATDGKPADHPFVVIVALPLDRRLEFATTSARATLLITQKP